MPAAVCCASVLDLMEADALRADAVLWLGISFEQSASVGYFRRVAAALQRGGRVEHTALAVVNPSDDALFNVQACLPPLIHKGAELCACR